LSHVIFTSEGEVTKLSPTRKVVKVIRHSPLTSEPRIKKSVHDKTPILKAVKQQAMTIKYVKPENCQCQKFTFVVNRKPVPKPDPAEHHPTCVHYVKPEEKPLPNFDSDKDFIAGPFPFKNPDTEGQIVK
jgi:hypothetical protein